MKNTGKALTLLSILVSVMLIFSSVLTVAVWTVFPFLKSEDCIKSRLSATGTYENVYLDLMKKYDEMSAVTSIPADVYKSSVSPEDIKDEMNYLISAYYSDIKEVSAPELHTGFGQLTENITDYFEKYSAENHVIKDEVYAQRLESAVQNANMTTGSYIDVCRFGVVSKTSLWPLIHRAAEYISAAAYGLLAADAVLIVLLVLLRSPLYWTGASAFASGLILTVPSLYVVLSDTVMKFSVKDFTVFTLFTDIMTSCVRSVLVSGAVLLAAGAVLTGVSVFRTVRKKPVKAEEKS